MKHAIVLAAVFFSLTTAALAGSGVSEIRIITPQWEGQTNEDGTGLFFDIIRAVYQPRGIAVQYRFAPWKRCQTLVSSGREDAMLCVWQAHARENGQLIPEHPFFIEQTAVVVKKASDICWEGIYSLDHRRAVWLRGYNYHTDPHLKGVQFSDWHEVDTYKEAWMQLNTDRFDAYLDALIDIDAYIKANKVDDRLYEKIVLWKENAYAAFSDTPKSRKLIAVYDGQFPELVASGRLAAIYEKWGVSFDPALWQTSD